jgi:hypothetical protein
MKGLYLSNIDPNKSFGYMPKILGQVKGFQQLGFEMDLICFNHEHEIVLVPFGAKEENYERETPILLAFASNNLFGRRLSLLRQMLKYLESQQVQFLYLRYPRSDPLFLYFLHKVRSKCPKLLILSEFPTFPYDKEYFLPFSLKDAIIFLLDKLTRQYLSRFIDRAISVNYEKPIFGIPIISIDNGILVADYTTIIYSLDVSPPALNLIGVANVNTWHGYDRVLHGLGHYYVQNHHPERSVVFHIVGAREPYLKELLALVTQLKITDYVVFHNPCQGKVLETIFVGCQLAVGVLGGHRKGLEVMSPLKNREYCARGIPFVFGHEDPDFPPDFPYALHLPSNEDPIDIQALINFIEKMGKINQNLNISEEMRTYATDHLDWSVKMKKVALAIRDALKDKGEFT